MLDPKLLRANLEETAKLMARRGFTLNVEELSTLEEQRKSIQVKNPRITKSTQYAF